MIKAASGSTGNWYVYDSMRGLTASDANDAELYASTPGSEYAGRESIDVTSTGFQLATTNTANNANNSTYIYMAIARPHKPASEFAATKLFDTNLTTSDSNVQTSLIRTDFNIQKNRGDSTYFFVQSRLTGNIKYLRTNATNAEGDYSTSDPVGVFDTQGQVRSYSGSDSNVIWSFMRAKGFCDVVTYAGTGSARTINHNLGVVPEMMWIKNRTQNGDDWIVYSSVTGATKYLKLNNNSSQITDSPTYGDRLNQTAPTASVFSVGVRADTNYNTHDYIAYLFASVAGISKIGSYTGTGSDLNVDCGFSAGARLVLIKRTDAESDWYVGFR